MTEVKTNANAEEKNTEQISPAYTAEKKETIKPDDQALLEPSVEKKGERGRKNRRPKKKRPRRRKRQAQKKRLLLRREKKKRLNRSRRPQTHLRQFP